MEGAPLHMSQWALNVSGGAGIPHFSNVVGRALGLPEISAGDFAESLAGSGTLVGGSVSPGREWLESIVPFVATPCF